MYRDSQPGRKRNSIGSVATRLIYIADFETSHILSTKAIIAQVTRPSHSSPTLKEDSCPSSVILWSFFKGAGMCKVVPNSDRVWSSIARLHTWQNGIFKDCHNSSADKTRDRDCDKPGHKNVSEESPVNSLFGSEPANGHNRTHLRETREINEVAGVNRTQRPHY